MINLGKIFILEYFLMFMFIKSYYKNDDPPLFDIISPFITLIGSIFPLILVPVHGYLFFGAKILLVISLSLESIADYYMGEENLLFSIVIFSVAHFFRQLAFVAITNFTSGFVNCYLLILSSLLLVKLLTTNKKENVSFKIIGCYAIIIFLSAIQISLIQEKLSYGYLLFIISDLIIGYDLVIHKIKPRYLRVIIVPLLYWIAQSLLTEEFLILSPK